VEENGMKYIRAEPALTLRLAKAAQEANLKKSSLIPAPTTAAAVEGAKGESNGTAVFTAMLSTSKGAAGVGVGTGTGAGKVSVPVSSKIDWGAVVTDAEVECEVVQDGIETAAEQSEVVEEEEEDCVNSTHFEEVIEVEDVFGCVVEETVRDVNRIEYIEEGDEGEEDEDDEEDDGEEEEEEEEEGGAPSVTPPPEAKKGDIDFSEDFFPTLSAVGPKRVKQWPLSTNENINRSPVTSNDDVFADAVEGEGEGVEEGMGEGKVSSAVPTAWGAAGGVGVVSPASASVPVPAKNWSQVAALSVQAAVVTASDNNHTVANR
jgi:hypothetical protein